ncbi:hypothetical protein [Lysinibacillus xylanilyticus]|uniref:hypothetical protein n=1 Tax=Lysinibacillus xylanilyticus TaxID=582475 RepID=UPI003D95E6EA
MEKIYLEVTDRLAVVEGNATTYIYGGIEMQHVSYAYVNSSNGKGYVAYNGDEESLESTNTIEITKEEFDAAHKAHQEYESGKETLLNPVVMERLEELEKENKDLKLALAESAEAQQRDNLENQLAIAELAELIATKEVL